MNRFFGFILSIIIILSSASAAFPAAFAVSESPAAGKVATESTPLNVRFAATDSAPVVASLKKGTTVSLISKNGKWWKVRYSSQCCGYCSSEFIKAQKASYYAYLLKNSANVNVRKGAGTAYEIKTQLPVGSKVAVLTQSGKWSRILYSGTKKGWVLTKYLSAKAPQLKAVFLDVPKYYQNDSRWNRIRLGVQGDTIGSSGCTTTSFAMVESFRKGKTVTPADMAKKLNYSESGSLYWPDDYYTELADSDFLERIYQILASGKPVIFGATKTGGGQHWVVVTGFNGSSLKKSAFSINDPGSSSRKTLADFMASYPNAYKFAWFS